MLINVSIGLHLGLMSIHVASGHCPSWLLRLSLQLLDHVSFLAPTAPWPDRNAFLSTIGTASPRGYLSLFGRPESQNPLNRNNCPRQSLCALLMLVTELFCPSDAHEPGQRYMQNMLSYVISVLINKCHECFGVLTPDANGSIQQLCDHARNRGT